MKTLDMKSVVLKITVSRIMVPVAIICFSWAPLGCFDYRRKKRNQLVRNSQFLCVWTF